MTNQEAARVIVKLYRDYSKGYGCEVYDEAVSRAVAALYMTEDTIICDKEQELRTDK